MVTHNDHHAVSHHCGSHPYQNHGHSAALLLPPSGLHIPPSYVAALEQLTEVLAASTIYKDEVPVPSPHESLRVEPSNKLLGTSKKVNHPPLRVDNPIGVQVLSNKPTLNDLFAPVPSTSMQPTYNNTIGIWGTQHYRQHCHQQPQPISKSKTVYPSKGTHHAPVHVATHCCKTCSKFKANQPVVHPQTALLGAAVDSDTGKIAEYEELSQ